MIAFLFPGQGSQKVGMGRALADAFPEARATFDEADAACPGLSDLIFDGPEETLILTENTQPAILATSIAAFRVMEQRGLRPDFVAGHSLGEYSALVAAGAKAASSLAELVRRSEVVITMVSDPAAVRESLDEIRKAGSRGRDLVQQILSFSRRQPTARRRIDPAPVVREAGRLLRSTVPSRLSLEVQCDPDVPHIQADATQIQQVLINLATNAMQAMPDGPGCITIHLDAVTLGVTDAKPAAPTPSTQVTPRAKIGASLKF